MHDGCTLNETCEGCTSQPVFICSMDSEQQKAAIARAATLATLDKLEGELYSKSEPLMDKEGVCYCAIQLIECDSIIESLRPQQAGEQE